jgi:hypothetical protein
MRSRIDAYGLQILLSASGPDVWAKIPEDLHTSGFLEPHHRTSQLGYTSKPAGLNATLKPPYRARARSQGTRMGFPRTNLLVMRSAFRGLPRNRMNRQHNSKSNGAIDTKSSVTSRRHALTRETSAADAEQLPCRQRIAAGEARAAPTPFARSRRSADHEYDHHQRRD